LVRPELLVWVAAAAPAEPAPQASELEAPPASVAPAAAAFRCLHAAASLRVVAAAAPPASAALLHPYGWERLVERQVWGLQSGPVEAQPAVFASWQVPPHGLVSAVVRLCAGGPSPALRRKAALTGRDPLHRCAARSSPSRAGASHQLCRYGSTIPPRLRSPARTTNRTDLAHHVHPSNTAEQSIVPFHQTSTHHACTLCVHDSLSWARRCPAVSPPSPCPNLH